MFFDTLRISQFILCKYDNLCWNGIACETDVENRDFKWSSCIHLIKVDLTGGLLKMTFAGFQIQI